MIVSYTTKCHAAAYQLLRQVGETVHHEIDEMIRSSIDPLPDVELIFCPVVFPAEELTNWPEKMRRSRTEKWVSFEQWLAIEPFLPPGRNTRGAYVAWIKSTIRIGEAKYPELAPARKLLDRLSAVP